MPSETPPKQGRKGREDECEYQVAPPMVSDGEEEPEERGKCSRDGGGDLPNRGSGHGFTLFRYLPLLVTRRRSGGKRRGSRSGERGREAGESSRGQHGERHAQHPDTKGRKPVLVLQAAEFALDCGAARIEGLG